MFEPCMECLWHSDGIVPSLASILTKQHSIRGGKYLLKTPGNAISETLNFKMSLDALALKKLCLWCKFQSRLLIIIGLLLKNFLTALLVKRLLTAKVLINNNTFPNDRYDTNSQLYSYRCRWGWSWPCFDTILSAFLHVGKKRKEVCVELGEPQPRSPLLKGQDTKPTALDM